MNKLKLVATSIGKISSETIHTTKTLVNNKKLTL